MLLLLFVLAVSRAYEILNDKSKRTRYDQLGEEGLSNHTHGDPFFRGGGGFEFDLFREMFGTNNPFGDGFGESTPVASNTECLYCS